MDKILGILIIGLVLIVIGVTVIPGMDMSLLMVKVFLIIME